MLQLTPEKIDDAVILMVNHVEPLCDDSCRLCVDFSVGIHNWLLANEVEYVMVDLQDEKDTCRMFLEELINLRKRLAMPFYFIGVMDRPRKFLDEFGVAAHTYFCLTPEEAADHFRKTYPVLHQNAVQRKVDLRSKITVSKARLQQRLGGDADAASDVMQGEVNL